jgi:hypothetical protein
MESTTGKVSAAPADELSPAKAFALLLGTACEQFDVIQALVENELHIAVALISAYSGKADRPVSAGRVRT